MNIHSVIVTLLLLIMSGIFVSTASVIPVSMTVNPDIPLGGEWNVPPAVWLIGSGLFGLIGFANRRHTNKRLCGKGYFNQVWAC